VSWHNILSRVNIASKILQKSDISISFLIEVLENLIEYLKRIRSDGGFKQLLVDAKKFAENVNVEPEFSHFRLSDHVREK
jgi:hypothetical protein